MRHLTGLAPTTNMESDTNLISFVLRFVSESSTDEQPAWHGVIRHVQTNQERHFTRWADAVAFIEQYVELKEERNEY